VTFRLHSRLVFWNLLIIAVIAAMLAYYLSSSIRDHLERQVESRLIHESVAAAAYLAQAGGEDNDRLADKLGEMLDLRVTLIAHDGKVLGDSELEHDELRSVENHRSRAEVVDAEAHGTGIAVRWSPTVHVEFIYVARRLEPYTLRLAMPLSALDALMADVRSHMVVAVLTAVGLILAFGYLVRGLISLPLRKLSIASTKLAAGDLSQRLPISGDEEIAALGNSLNTMAANLSNQMHALTEGKRRLESIVSAMSEGVMVLDSSGRISLANHAVHDLLSSDRDLIGKTSLEVFRRPELEQAIRRVLQNGSSSVIEMTLGNSYTIQANIAPVPNVEGVVDAIVVVFHDLTEIRRTESMRRDFVANVSHEFKTPLTSIKGYAETLLSGAMNDPSIAGDFLRTIEHNAEHLEALVTDLLTLARIESQLPVTMDQVNPRSVIEEEIALRGSLISERQLKAINECVNVLIRADRGRLAAAFSNLLDNAIYYNRPGGEIRITGQIRNGGFELAIADTGVGIRTEDLPRIFERFYRVDKARSRQSGRTGLGLSIVKHAIESQGGSIAVSSRIGIGSTFTIKLPVYS
jgi:two-component system, OmpR family, phosphate regulon sensor histidine kinase PhoR